MHTYIHKQPVMLAVLGAMLAVCSRPGLCAFKLGQQILWHGCAMPGQRILLCLTSEIHSAETAFGARGHYLQSLRLA